MEYRFFVDNDVLRVEPPLVKHELPCDNAALLLIGIQKWEAMVSFVEEHKYLPSDGGMVTCAPCMVYEKCAKCPARCVGSPYDDWWYARDFDDVEAGLAAAHAEVEFLKGILESLSN